MSSDDEDYETDEKCKNSVCLNIERSDMEKGFKATVKLVGDESAEKLLEMAKKQLKEMK